MNRDLTCLRDPVNGDMLVLNGDSMKSKSGHSYPIIQGIPRFVGAENYSNDFGDQWNMFPKTQLDSFTGFNHSEERLSRCLRGSLASLKGSKVLEAGSGAGRFTEVLLKYGAVVHSFDYSSAVDASAKNNGSYENLILVQADIRSIPFPKASYDYVICLGVLQHTPSPEESIKCLWEMVRPGGVLVIDHYIWKWRLILPPPIGGFETIYRWLILRLPRKSRFKAVKALTDFWFPLHWRFKNSLLMQRILLRISPVHFQYYNYMLHDRKICYESTLLNTIDATTDFYKHRRRPNQIRKLLKEIGSEDIKVEVGGNGVEAFCRKSNMVGKGKTENSYWDDQYKMLPRKKLKNQFWVGTRDYYNLLSRFINPGSKVLEIGCAPGKTLAWAAKIKKAKVTGVDYSKNGIKVSRWLFDQMKLEGNFLCEDVFRTTLPEKTFDFVISAGLIEHFDDPTEIIDVHIRLAKPGGVVLVTIPNYGGFYGKLQRFFNPDNLHMHNLSIMSTEALKRAVLKNHYIQNVRVYSWGRTHPFLVHFSNKINNNIAWTLSLMWNCIGWLQPVHIPFIAPLLVLEIHRSKGEF